MYTRKPKDMTKFLVGITSAQALHTWQYADKKRLAQMGSSAPLPMSARKKRDANRKTIGQYRNSKIATVATSMRGEVAKFTQSEQTKRQARFNQAHGLDNKVPPGKPAGSLKERPLPDASLYRRPSV